jgi:pimeloyl-ACP methyl ester carboxylesterase
VARDEARERYTAVGGQRVHVRESGQGDPLLLINGIGAHVGMWSAVERALPDVRLIAFDAPGAGRSPTPVVPLSFEALADLTESLLDQLGYGPVDVLGYSFGGLVAQFLARQSPARVRRLILAATAPGWGGVPGSVWTLSQMSTPLRYYWRPYYESVIGRLMGGRARTDGEFVRRHGDIRQRHPPNPVGYLWQLWAMFGSSGTLPWLGELGQPTLVVAGDDDPVMPVANAMLLARAIPGARLLVARGEGHLLLMDDDSAALPAIREFVGGFAGAAVRVSDEMVDAALQASGSVLGNPLAMVSAWARAMQLAM